MIPFSLFILLLAAVAFCFACNRDIFSPAKFYHAYLGVFFAAIFFSEHSGYIYAVYFGFILAGMLLSLLEAHVLARRDVRWTPLRTFTLAPRRFVVILWGLTAIPILSQFYLIHTTGGWTALAMTIAHRVAVWQGLGPVLMLISMMAPINLVYLAVGLVYGKRHPGLWWVFYGLHLLLFLFTALLLASRGFFLGQLVLMMLVYNYLRKPVKLKYALCVGAVLLFVAAFLGTVRNNVTRLAHVEKLADLEGEALNMRMFSYGVNPMDIVFSRDFADYQYGKTFLTPITNFIPRRIWPGKFESGGVVLTKFWLGHRYTGLTNMSTGLVTESILNFGYPLGILVGFAFLLFVVLVTLRWYAHLRSHLGSLTGLRRVYLVCIYAYIAQIGGNLLCGELQSCVGPVLFRLLLLSVLMFLLRVRVFCVPCVQHSVRGVL